MFRKPFEEVLSSKNLINIENIKATKRGENITELFKNVINTEDYRAFPIIQEDLLEDSWEYPEDYDKKSGRFKAGSYNFNKLGSKYLRAPDILFTILEKAKNKLIPLNKIAKIYYGEKTVLSEFFYLDEEKIHYWQIENTYVQQFITSTKETGNFIIDNIKTNKYVFRCSLTKKELLRKGSFGALKYIKWGEKQKTKKKAEHTISGIFFPHVPSVSGNNPWYNLGKREAGDLIIPALIREKYVIPLNSSRLAASNMFYNIKFKNPSHVESCFPLLNSSLSYFFLEILGRINIGGRLNFYSPEIKSLILPDLNSMNSETKKKMINLFKDMTKRDVLPILRELKNKDRLKFDKIIFNYLGLNDEEINAFYKAFSQSINQRLKKELSLKNRG